MEPVLTPRIFCLRVLRDLLKVSEATSVAKLFEMAAQHQNIPEYDATARVDYQRYLETGYPPAYVEGAFHNLVDEASRKRA